MTIKHKGNQEYEGLGADTKPVPADTAVNATFAETDTGNQFRNNGNAWASYGGGDVAGLPMWIVYKSGSTYKAKNGVTGLTPYSGTNLVTDVWNNIVNNPASKNHIHFLNGTYDVPSGSTLTLTGSNLDYAITGESKFGTIIRPLGNTIVLSTTNGRRQVFKDFTIYIDQGVAYTTDCFRIIGSDGGCEHIDISNIKMRQDAGTGTITQGGRGLVFLLVGNGNATSIDLRLLWHASCGSMLPICRQALPLRRGSCIWIGNERRSSSLSGIRVEGDARVNYRGNWCDRHLAGKCEVGGGKVVRTSHDV